IYILAGEQGRGLKGRTMTAQHVPDLVQHDMTPVKCARPLHDENMSASSVASQVPQGMPSPDRNGRRWIWMPRPRSLASWSQSARTENGLGRRMPRTTSWQLLVSDAR